MREQFNQITDLMIAASRGDLPETRRLIEAGQEINAVDQFGNTSLIYAALAGQAEIVELLLRNGADTRIKNKRGRDCLELAKERGHERVAAVLRTAKLLLLIRDGEIGTIVELLEAGVNVNLQVIGGWTPLMVAALEDQFQIVELLLAHGAQVAIENAQGFSAEAIAARKGHLRIASLLRSQRAAASSDLPGQQADLLELDDLTPPVITADDKSEILN